MQAINPGRSVKLEDALLLGIMLVLAGCGLIYEYLLSHYAGRVLGTLESAIYAMIGLMIVSMGIGAFAARGIKDHVSGFAWLELVIAILGAFGVLLISGLIAFTQSLPQIIADTFSLPPDALPQGGLFKTLHKLATYMPFVLGFLLGFFIGMEIPLIAKIREQVYQKHLENNAGTIYGADYIGAGIGAAIWVWVLLKTDITQSAALTASFNLIAGLIFYFRYRQYIRKANWLLAGHLVLSGLLVLVFQYGTQWQHRLTDSLYLDKVVYQDQTRFQHLVLTERQMNPEKPSVLNLYLNGRLQFSSNDEAIYHGMLVYPTLMGSARHKNILVIGGGDGLAVRDILRWDPDKITLLDLDHALVDIFVHPHKYLSPRLAQQMDDITQASLRDPRVELRFADAFVEVDQMIDKGQSFDAIIVDLPDPNHPDLNRLYSDNFYARLKLLLAGDGLITVQSTSPYHAKPAFISIGKTLAAAGFNHVEQYHANVPSFGEWGWSIASKYGKAPSARINEVDLSVQHPWVNKRLIQAAFAFPQDFYVEDTPIEINRLGSHQLYQYHQSAWQNQQGLNNSVIIE